MGGLKFLPVGDGFLQGGFPLAKGGIIEPAGGVARTPERDLKTGLRFAMVPLGRLGDAEQAGVAARAKVAFSPWMRMNSSRVALAFLSAAGRSAPWAINAW